MAKVMKADGSAAHAFAHVNLPFIGPEYFVSFQMRLQGAALTRFITSGGYAEFVAFTAQSGMTNKNHQFWLQDPVAWGDGPWALTVNGVETDGEAPTPTPDAWMDILIHVVEGTVAEITVDATLAISAADTDTGYQLTQFNLGIVSFSGADADAVIYYRDLKIGTTEGGDDVFAEDFSSATFDAWSSTTGDVSIIDDPFVEPPASVVVLDRPTWKWIVADLRSSRVLTWITTVATDITTSRLLAAAWPASLTVPSDDPRVRTTYVQFDGHPEWDEPFVARNIRALIGFRDTGTDPLWEVAYAAPIFQVADTVEDGVPRSRLNAWDCRKYLEFLPLVDADGDLPGENGITFTAQTANAIARAALENWITNNPGCLAETLFDLSGGADETCAELTMTFNRGTTIADVWTQLEQTGAIDIVLDPVFDPRVRPGCLAVVNFEVEHGVERPAAIFSWDRSPRSLPQIGRMEDGLKLANTIQDYTDDVEPADAATDTDSVTRFGEYWAMRAWTGQEDATAVAAFAAEEIIFRKAGQTTVSASPSAPRSLQPIQEYDIGDRVPVYASERLRKPIATTMRIYGIPFTIDENAVETVSELIVSADAVVL